MKKTIIVNIYNFIRMSHVEPSRFIIDDFETIQNQLILVKQFGFPGTYALKYDALMDTRYQALLKEYLDENDEISAWWEISEPLCRRAGVNFRGQVQEEYDDRVDSAYPLGYEPWERKRLVDAYMEDFFSVFGKYPETIGSWVLDSITLDYAAKHYGVVGGAICRDQMGVDGFTLWGGWPNGMYYPSKKNGFIPAQTIEEQISIPMFRLLGPDPIYNFEADVREGLQGVYTLEPSWLAGRDPNFISWLFDSLTKEDALGIGYAHIGQENNFLWENIRPGFGPQLTVLEQLAKEGKVRVETMAQSAKWFQAQYRLTPPLSFQASKDWDKTNNLSTQWYASANYRISFLGEQNHLRIRDFFLYRQEYPCRYLEKAMDGTKSTFDALPVLFPQIWGGMKNRPFIRLVDELGQEPEGMIQYNAPNEFTARTLLLEEASKEVKAEFTMTMDKIELQSKYCLQFDRLPVFKSCQENAICMEHEGFSYQFLVETGTISVCNINGVIIKPENGIIRLILGQKLDKIRYEEEIPFPVMKMSEKRPVPPIAPVATPSDSVFKYGTTQTIVLTSKDKGEIRYTLDGSEPTKDSLLYQEPIIIDTPTTLLAKLFLLDGRISNVTKATYTFALKDIKLESPTILDKRIVFSGNGIQDLLESKRGTLDFLDGTWRGTLNNLDVIGEFPTLTKIQSIGMGFLSHHRGGIIYPESVELYVGADKEHLTQYQVITLPTGPCEREIAKTNIVFEVNETIGAFRFVAKRYKVMPEWCCYRGSTGVFTMADNLIVIPQK